MNPIKMITFVTIFAILSSLAMWAGEKKPLMPADLYNMNKVSDPQVSPDGRWVVYVIAVPNLKENTFKSNIWLIPVSGGQAKQLTASGNNHSPRWFPNSKRLAFISSRNGAGNIYMIDLDGGEARQLTKSKTSLWSPIVSKTGNHILCASRVMPEAKKNPENWNILEKAGNE